jgi:GR25 family glycosyltransferase involved in LPS biosynthesis
MSSIPKYVDLIFYEIEKIDPHYGNYLYINSADQWYEKLKFLYSPPPSYRELTIGEIACTSTHFYIYNDFYYTSKDEWCIVIEDDALLIATEHEFLEIPLLLDNLNLGIDCIFLGGGFEHSSVSKTLFIDGNIHYKKHPSTNTTVAYAIRRSAIRNIVTNSFNFTLPIDYELAFLLMRYNMNVVHRIPYFFGEGSKSVYKSSLGKFLGR